MNVLLFFVIVRCLGSQKWALAKLTEKWEMGRGRERWRQREEFIWKNMGCTKRRKARLLKNGSRAVLKIERPTLITVLSAFAMNRYQDFSVSVSLPSQIQVPGSRLQWFSLAHHPLPNSRESWAPSFQAQSWLWLVGQSIRKIQETSSRRMNNRSWTNRNNRCAVYQAHSSF